MGKQQFCTFILIDGKVDGRIKCTASIDKSCVGFKLSHSAAIGKNDDIKDLNNGGIYFLFGRRENEASGCEGTFYVGQAAVRKNEKGLLQRINENHKPLLKWNWDTVIIFTTNNSDLDSAQINYLENKFYNLAKNVKRYEMKNKQEPHKGIVKITSEISANQFVEAVILITEFLGYRVFEKGSIEDDCKGEKEHKVIKNKLIRENDSSIIQTKITDNLILEVQDDNADLLHLAGKKITATGKKLEKGFLVYKGSKFSQTESVSCKIGTRNKRAFLLKDGKVKNGKFLEDVLFKSSSTAASCVLGREASGNELWLDSKNIKLGKSKGEHK